MNEWRKYWMNDRRTDGRTWLVKIAKEEVRGRAWKEAKSPYLVPVSKNASSLAFSTDLPQMPFPTSLRVWTIGTSDYLPLRSNGFFWTPTRTPFKLPSHFTPPPPPLPPPPLPPPYTSFVRRTNADIADNDGRELTEVMVMMITVKWRVW